MTAPLQKEMKGSLKRTFEGNRRVVNRAEADENVSLFYGMPAGALYYDVMDNSSSLVNMTMITGEFQDATFYNYSRDINGRLSVPALTSAICSNPVRCWQCVLQ